MLISIREMQIKSTPSLTLPQTEGTSPKYLQTIPARIAEILAEYINWRKYELVMMAIKNRRKGPLNLQTDLPYDWAILHSAVSMGKSYIETHLLKNLPWFVVIHTVKVFSVVSEADASQEFSCFFYDPTEVGNLISGSSSFSKSNLNI